MAYDTLTRSPAIGDFTSLDEHQEQTPGTFFGGKPVLHLQSPAAKLRIDRAELTSQPNFAKLLGTNPPSSNDEVVEIENIDVWVTSRDLTLFSTTHSHGLQIPYPTISIHAQDGDAVLLELILSPPDTMDEDLVFLQLRITPTTVQHHAALETAERQQMNGDSASNGMSSGPTVILYNAISACQELNPDTRPENADSEEDGEGGAFFDETAPGATGWITSENMADFLDADGNLRLPSGNDDVVMIGEEADTAVESGSSNLGEGAGRRRTAAEVEATEDNQAGGEDETKWQRTG